MSLKDFQLDGNGFLFNLYHLLWLEDPITKTNLQINIPDTLFITQGQPQIWYCNSNGTIVKKTKSNLDKQYIIDHMINDKNDTQTIACVWITIVKGETIFEYLSPQQLYQFVTKLNFETTGYLQKFLYPKSKNNSIIKCTWGNRLSFYELIINKYALDQYKADIYQRAVTFEMLNSPSYVQVVRKTELAQKLDELCRNIVNHVSSVSSQMKNISQMELYCKVSQNGQLYFIFCSRIQTSGSAKQNQPQFSICKQLTPQLINYPKVINLGNYSQCISCEQQRNNIHFSTIQFKDIIANWHYVDQKLKSQIKEHQVNKAIQPKQIVIDVGHCIPKIIPTIFPNLQTKEYEELKKNVVFPNSQITLCNECCAQVFSHQMIPTREYENKPIYRKFKTESVVIPTPKIHIRRLKKDLYFNLTESKIYSQIKQNQLLMSKSSGSNVFKSNHSTRNDN